MSLKRLVGECEDGECATIYATGRGTVAVQGTLISGHGLTIPDQEALVEIPIHLIRRVVHEHLN
ncbi:hypothetical protein ACFVIM_22190 [Streptomyces sp. NPDC057638]|uniref:hypothetical protein n=1 Tax=Streptomyces sp. NPDC057638 TaxID=3346190 RepID=UPI00369060C6